MSEFFANYSGELYALLVAFLWAMSSILYAKIGKVIHPLELNLIKGVLAITFVVITLLITNQLRANITPLAFFLLFVSGAFGIGLGDTAYLEALRLIGPRMATLIKITAPPFAGIISWVFLGEVLGFTSWLGITIIVASIAFVVVEKTRPTPNQVNPSAVVPVKLSIRGVIMALIAAVCEAIGVVASHAALTITTVQPMWSTFFRLFAGIVTSLVLILINRQPLGAWRSQPGIKKTAGMVVTVVFFATFLGIFLQQMSLQTTPAGVTQTLIATSPIFVIPITALLGEKVNLRTVIGSLAAIVGVTLLFLPN